jgi:hypothetical protein
MRAGAATATRIAMPNQVFRFLAMRHPPLINPDAGFPHEPAQNRLLGLPPEFCTAGEVLSSEKDDLPA